jgi:hypothetical protein
MAQFSLPPAVYKISFAITSTATPPVTTTYYVTDPAADNDKIELKVDTKKSDQQVRCMMSSTTIKFISDGNHIIQWLISADGIIRSLDHDKKFASARLAPKTSNIIRSSSSLKWVIALMLVYSQVYRYMPHSSMSIALRLLPEAQALSEQMMARSASGVPLAITKK